MPHRDRRNLLVEAAGRAADYLEGLDARSVDPVEGAVDRLAQALDAPLPAEPGDDGEILAFMDALGSPATVASAGGRYFGFVTGGALPATVAAQVLAAAWDQNSFNFTSSPAIALFEDAALRWIVEAFGLPSETGGALVTGATMANFTCLAAARNDVLKDHGWNVDRDGLMGAPEISVVVGEEAHATVYKVLSLLGLGRDRVISVPADRQGRMRADRLPEIAGPAIVCIQAGNVNSGAFDPADAIIAWAKSAGAWVHVDGAFGLWALTSPDMAHLAKAFRGADSCATDAHKWLNVPYDSGIALVRDTRALAEAMSISGSYLLPSDRRDAIDYTPESSRRARAIEVWAALKLLGRTGLAEMIERCCRHARRFAEALEAEGVEVLNEVVLNQVVVALGDAERTARVVRAIQQDGTCWCGGTTWQGRSAMRISVSSWATTDADVELSVQAILEANRRCN